jgi:hypothetical protein
LGVGSGERSSEHPSHWAKFGTSRRSALEPNWDLVPTDEEILLARSVLRRMSHVVGESDEYVWDGLVEARRMLTVSVDHLSSYDGHYRKYHGLWLKMLKQDDR